MDKVYCYTPISRDHETRVLRLAPGKGPEPLRGQLFHVDLDRRTSYEALSYEWGNPKKENTIHLDNGTRILVTKSLGNALQDIRHEENSRVVWADGICINQDDIEERQQQVSMMGTIYSKASRVLTYIGPEKDGSTIAIDFAYQLLRKYESAAGEIPKRHLMDNPPKMVLPPESDPRYSALKKLIMRGWSSRSWCAQEFLLNKNLTMLCGRTAIDWFLIPTLVQLCFEQSLPAFLVPNAVDDPQDRRECLLKLWMLRRRIFLDRAQLSFWEFLTMLHPFRATDPRDKIYALFGLLSDHETIDIPVDYSCTTELLYTTVACRVLTSTSCLDILYSNFGRKAFDLPSWVPDWSTWQVASQGTALDHFYQACGTTISEFELQPRAKLDIMGCLVDKIVQQSEPIGQYYAYVGVPGQQRWLEEQSKFVEKVKPYPTGDDISEVLWRTLIGDITLDEERAGDDYRAYFDAHKNFSKDASPVYEHMEKEFVDAVRRRSRYRRLCITEQGYFGGVPEEAKIGDWICMFHGMKLLFVVREAGPNFTYIGHAYVHGLMHGEVFQLSCYKKRRISLV